MAENIFKVFTGADDHLEVIDENEVTDAISMANVEKATIVATGTFGGATITVQISNDGTNFVSSGLTLAAAGKVDLTLPCKQVRCSVAGGTAASLRISATLRTF